MKPLYLFAAVLLSGWALQARAADYFAAVDVSPVTLWQECHWLAICPGTSYDARSYSYGARAGFWVAQQDRDKSGVEIGYARLGRTSGSKDYLLSPCTPFCTGATATWKNEATLAYVALMGQAYLGPRAGKEAVTAKIGIYDAHVDTTGNYGTGGPNYTRKVNSAGLMMGAGYAYTVSQHVSLVAAADLFFNVKTAKPIDPNGQLSELLLRLEVGAEYTF